MNRSSVATLSLLLLLTCIVGCDAGSTGSPTSGPSDSGLVEDDAPSGDADAALGDVPAADSGEAQTDTTQLTDGSGDADASIDSDAGEDTANSDSTVDANDGSGSADSAIDGSGSVDGDASDASDVTDASDATTDTATDAGTGTSVVIGAAGGVVEFGGYRLELPPGAITVDTVIEVRYGTRLTDGLTAFSPVYEVRPAALPLLLPSRLSIAYAGGSVLAAIYEADASAGWTRVGGGVVADRVATTVSQLGDVVVGDGVAFTLAPDSRCLRPRVVSGSDAGATGVPSGNALVLSVVDCENRPVQGLDLAAFAVLEDGRPVGPDADTAFLRPGPVRAFVSLVLDLASSSASYRAELSGAVMGFLDRLRLSGQDFNVEIIAFGGEAEAHILQSFTSDWARLGAAASQVATFAVADPGAADLHGAIVQSTAWNIAAQSAFETRNLGGGRGIGFVAYFTDSGDTAGRVGPDVALGAIGAPRVKGIEIVLGRPELDREGLAQLQPAQSFEAPTVAELPRSSLRSLR